jgi:hypothetical protein
MLILILVAYLAIGIVCAIAQVILQVLHGNPASHTVDGNLAWKSMAAAALVLAPMWPLTALAYLYMQVRDSRAK